MLATAKLTVFPAEKHPNHWMGDTVRRSQFHRFCREVTSRTYLLGWRFIVAMLFGLVGIASAELSETNRARFAAHTQKMLNEAQNHYDQSPTNTTAAWEYASALFDRAEFSINDTERATIAERGIAVSRKALKSDPQSGPLHYYLGLSLAQLARTKSFGALKILPEMEREFKAAIAADEKFDYAGAHRAIGILYFQAPGWSVGSRSKASKHLERAVGLAPGFPENHIVLAEAYLEWRDKNGLRRELEALQKIWLPAKAKLTGPDWEHAWMDWTERRQELEKRSVKLLK